MLDCPLCPLWPAVDPVADPEVEPLVDPEVEPLPAVEPEPLIEDPDPVDADPASPSP
jgi:hypothetical protein